MLVLLLVCVASWSYDDLDWSSEYPDCASDMQSPIMLGGGTAGADVRAAPLTFAYSNSSATMENDGKHLVVTPAASSTLLLGNTTYTLQSLSLFVGGHLDGTNFELHLRHVGSVEDVVMLAVPFEDDDTPSAFLEALVDVAGAVAPGLGPVSVPHLDLASLVSAAGEAHLRYSGSLAHPPCTEDVAWIVLEDAHGMTEDQAYALLATWNESMPAGRDPQPRNGREVIFVDEDGMAFAVSFASMDGREAESVVNSSSGLSQTQITLVAVAATFAFIGLCCVPAVAAYTMDFFSDEEKEVRTVDAYGFPLWHPDRESFLVTDFGARSQFQLPPCAVAVCLVLGVGLCIAAIATPRWIVVTDPRATVEYGLLERCEASLDAEALCGKLTTADGSLVWGGTVALVLLVNAMALGTAGALFSLTLVWELELPDLRLSPVRRPSLLVNLILAELVVLVAAVALYVGAASRSHVLEERRWKPGYSLLLALLGGAATAMAAASGLDWARQSSWFSPRKVDKRRLPKYGFDEVTEYESYYFTEDEPEDLGAFSKSVVTQCSFEEAKDLFASFASFPNWSGVECEANGSTFGSTRTYKNGAVEHCDDVFEFSSVAGYQYSYIARAGEVDAGKSRTSRFLIRPEGDAARITWSFSFASADEKDMVTNALSEVTQYPRYRGRGKPGRGKLGKREARRGERGSSYDSSSFS